MDSGDITAARLMIFRQLFVLLVLISANTADARTPRLPEQLERFDGCVLTPDQLNDGDSFLVQLPDGRRSIFRLYFVDTAEEHLSGSQTARQATSFRIDRHRLGAIGRDAAALTAHALAKPFTVFTRWQSNFDEGRYLAFVRTADGKDLAELLVRKGLAILGRGERTDSPYGRNSRSQFRRLKELERLAQADRVGGWAEP